MIRLKNILSINNTLMLPCLGVSKRDRNLSMYSNQIHCISHEIFNFQAKDSKLNDRRDDCTCQWYNEAIKESYDD